MKLISVTNAQNTSCSKFITRDVEGSPHSCDGPHQIELRALSAKENAERLKLSLECDIKIDANKFARAIERMHGPKIMEELGLTEDESVSFPEALMPYVERFAKAMILTFAPHRQVGHYKSIANALGSSSEFYAPLDELGEEFDSFLISALEASDQEDDVYAIFQPIFADMKAEYGVSSLWEAWLVIERRKANETPF